MPLQAIDVQTNIAQMDKLGQDMNKIQFLAEREQSHAAKILEKFSKNIDKKLIKASENAEDQRIEEHKDEQEKKNKRRKRREELLAEAEEEMNLQNRKKFSSHSYKGIFIDITE